MKICILRKCCGLLKWGAALLQGAVENVLERSTKVQLLDGTVVPLDENSKNSIVKALNEMSTSALRCLGFAFKDELTDFESYDGDEDHPAHRLLLDPSTYSSIESNLVFVGLVGLWVSCHMASLHFCTYSFHHCFIIF